jgi:hypothetical protein
MQTPTESAAQTPAAMPITKTNAYTLLTLFVRLAAVFGFAEVFYVGTAQMLVLGPGIVRDWGMTLLIVMVIISLSVFAAMWIFADKIAGWALARRDSAQFESQLGVQQWQHIGFAMIGAWFVMEGLVQVGSNLRSWTMLRWGESDYTPEQINSVLWSGADWVIQIALGIGLMLGARGLAGLLHRLRTAGQPSSSPPNDAA